VSGCHPLQHLVRGLSCPPPSVQRSVAAPRHLVEAYVASATWASGWRTSLGAVPPIALVTGANRGLGLEVARQLAGHGFTTVLGARDLDKGRAAADALAADGVEVHPRALDVADSASVAALGEDLRRDFGALDVLVNNAAIHYDTWQRGVDADLEIVSEALDTNLLGAWRTAQACVPLLRRSGRGRIVNVSSESGALSSMGAGAPAYSVSKAALNALTRILAAELRADGVLVNAVCPGWVATDMGGPGGRPVAEGAASVMWAVLLPDDGPSGGFFRDGRRLDW
jgi:NAD(P)-dependent dehydrogenase (short-subunit alcohol dehydrogenase family)